MQFARWTPALWVTGICAVLAALLLASPSAGLVVQFILGKFVYSTSNGASLYLLAFASLAAWRLAMGGATHPGAVWVLAAALALGMGLHLWMTLRYLQEMHIPWAAHALHWNAQSYSFTSLFHSHIGKTGYAVLGQALDWTPKGIDSGTVFLPWVPTWAAWMLGLCFALGVCACGLALSGFAHSHAPQHTALFVLSSAVSLRAMMDGGLLASATLPALAGWVWVVVASGRGPHFVRWVAFALGLLLLGWVGWWMQSSTGIPPVGETLFTVLWVLMLALPFRTLAQRLRSSLLLATALGMAWWDGTVNLLPLLQPMPEGCRAVSFGPHEPRTWDCTAQSAVNTYLHFGEDPRKPHHTLIAPVPSGGTRTLPLDLLIIDSRAAALTTTVVAPWHAMALQPVTLANGWLRADLTADALWPAPLTTGWPDSISRNNYNVYAWQFGASLLAQGVTEFVVVPRTVNNAVDSH